jgi:hypothetical protein
MADDSHWPAIAGDPPQKVARGTRLLAPCVVTSPVAAHADRAPCRGEKRITDEITRQKGRQGKGEKGVVCHFFYFLPQIVLESLRRLRLKEKRLSEPFINRWETRGLRCRRAASRTRWSDLPLIQAPSYLSSSFFPTTL